MINPPLSVSEGVFSHYGPCHSGRRVMVGVRERPICRSMMRAATTASSTTTTTRRRRRRRRRRGTTRRIATTRKADLDAGWNDDLDDDLDDDADIVARCAPSSVRSRVRWTR